MAKLNDHATHTWGPIEQVDYTDPSVPAASREKLLDIIAKSAFDNLRAYSNCCRSTLWAIQTHLRLEDAGTLKASTTLAGGIAGEGETCGALLGALMAIGQALGSDRFDPDESYLRARAAAKAMAEAFAEAFGGTRCYTVQETLIGWCCDDPSKTEAWRAANGQIACASACAVAARTAARIILDANASQTSSAG